MRELYWFSDTIGRHPLVRSSSICGIYSPGRCSPRCSVIVRIQFGDPRQVDRRRGDTYGSSPAISTSQARRSLCIRLRSRVVNGISRVYKDLSNQTHIPARSTQLAASHVARRSSMTGLCDIIVSSSKRHFVSRKTHAS